MLERLEELNKIARANGHCMSGPAYNVDVVCTVCIDCGKEIHMDRDSGKVYIDDAIVIACE